MRIDHATDTQTTGYPSGVGVGLNPCLTPYTKSTPSGLTT